MIFQHFLNTNVWENIFDLALKRSRVTRELSIDQISIEPPMLYAKIQRLRASLVLLFFLFCFFCFFFFTIYGHGGLAAIVHSFDIMPHVKSDKKWSIVSDKKTFKYYTIL